MITSLLKGIVREVEDFINIMRIIEDISRKMEAFV
jgi:hypothetical protein